MYQLTPATRKKSLWSSVASVLFHILSSVDDDLVLVPQIAENENGFNVANVYFLHHLLSMFAEAIYVFMLSLAQRFNAQHEY